jgi:riboflavin synthase
VFTGIVEERGSVVAPGERLEIRASTVSEDAGPGSSMAVNGVCLTVVGRRENGNGSVDLAFDLSPETIARSTLGRLRPGDPVNLERPVTLLTRLGGHLVQGHVDGVGRIVERPGEAAGEMEIEAPSELARYLVEKGSVAVDGVSLTVASVRENRFRVALIPHTLAATTLGATRRDDAVNLEVDVMAKYVEGLVRRGA